MELRCISAIGDLQDLLAADKRFAYSCGPRGCVLRSMSWWSRAGQMQEYEAEP